MPGEAVANANGLVKAAARDVPPFSMPEAAATVVLIYRADTVLMFAVY